MKLKNIKIENYRFFKEEQEFNFVSKADIPQNILLYGENGSGKTSLYNALKDFFFYYKNPSESKTKIKENKNIFCEITDEPKIEIIFENDTNIKFTGTGFDKEDLKGRIEEVSKSRLFLTYQDIYNLNNIFKKDLTYKEFKNISTILYFDDLNHLFNEFENNLNELSLKIQDIDTLEEDYKVIKRLIEEFDETFTYELDPIEKKDPIDKDIVPNVYDTVYYLDTNLLDELEGNKLNLTKFLNICEKILDIDSFDLIEKYDDIINNVRKYTKENDRYNEEQIIAIDEVINEGNSYLDDFNTNILMRSLISESYIKCEEFSSQINDKTYNNLDSSIDKINFILSFLEINIKIEKIMKKPFINFDLEYITQKEDIKNIDFKILLSDKELKNHWSNLNEAKLSALNLAIYFSSVLGKKPYIPILVLDDLLISLDMSNRDKILSLLLDRRLNEDGQPIFFDDSYQMLIFTHDRAFFELAKYRFDSKASDKWKYFEMYEREKENKYFPFLTESLTYLEKAEKYFVLNEYEIAGNLLRKEAEKFCKEFLPKKYHYSEEYNLKELNGLINECINFAKNSDFESDLFEKLDKHRKFVLNPNSHDSYNVMKFRTEIKNCLDTFKELKKLKNQPFLNKGELLEFELTCIKGDLYKFEITLEDDFRLLQKDGNKVISKGLINYRIKRNETYTKSEREHDNCTLKKFYSKNYDKSDGSKNSDFLEEIVIKGKGIKLKDICS